MAQELTLPKGFGAVSSVFRGQAGNDELGAGIASSYGVIGYRGKVWSTKYQGKETQLMRDDGDGARFEDRGLDLGWIKRISHAGLAGRDLCLEVFL